MTADQSPAPARTPEEVARAFHEAYERLAPAYGYRTRRESAVPWEDVPSANQTLMIAVASEVLALVRPVDGVVLTLAEAQLAVWALRHVKGWPVAGRLEQGDDAITYLRRQEALRHRLEAAL